MVNPLTTLPPPHSKLNTILLYMQVGNILIILHHKPNPKTKSRPPVP